MGTSPKRGLTVAVLAVTFFGTTGVRAATPSPSPETAATVLLSVATDGTQANADSFAPALSGDGSAVAFTSLATNLAGPESVPTMNVFVHDPLRGQTTRISDSPGGEPADGDSTSPVLSGDGSVVAFDSFADNLVSGDSNGASDVFVHERASGRTTRVSVASDGAQSNGGSFSPSISANGRFVAFASDATALVPGDHNRDGDVFVHDRQTGKTTLISVTSDGKPANGDSFAPAISADGRFVAFVSHATNLVGGDTNGAADVFVHDRENGRTMRVSVGSDGAQIDSDSFGPSISGDGRYVAFATDAGNVVPGDMNGASDVFVHDGQTGRTALVSAKGDGHPSDRGSSSPALSADSRAVAFVTDGALLPDDTNNTEDVYVADLATGALRRMSLASDGTEGNRPSLTPAVSATGTVVAFESLATNLAVADSNGAGDVFWRR
jgi:Tol biopolymer transport system component